MPTGLSLPIPSQKIEAQTAWFYILFPFPFQLESTLHYGRSSQTGKIVKIWWLSATWNLGSLKLIFFNWLCRNLESCYSEPYMLSKVMDVKIDESSPSDCSQIWLTHGDRERGKRGNIYSQLCDLPGIYPQLLFLLGSPRQVPQYFTTASRYGAVRRFVRIGI
jgi:hypothetical protein